MSRIPSLRRAAHGPATASPIARLALLVLLSLAALAPAAAFAQSCLDPRGDVDANGSTTVTDVQCLVLTALWEIGGATGPQPICLKVTLQQADMNCDGAINVADVQIVVRHALNIPLPTAIDADQNGCVDICELDSDGDGDGDFIDCSPYNPNIFSGAPEICNGIDDNCNGIVDDDFDPSVAASCQNETVCDGLEQCVGQPPGLGLMINEIMITPQAVAPSAGQWVELYNPTDLQIDINGWRLETNQGSHLISNLGALRVPPGGYLVLARSIDPAQNGGFNAQYQYPGLLMNPAGDKVALRNAASALVDQVLFNDADFPIVPGASIALIDPALDNSVATSWAASTGNHIGMNSVDRGTPKSSNFDVLDPATCVDGPDLVCDDGIDCTIDTCDDALGCQVAADDGACDDGIACTIDACDVDLGCVFTPDDGACDDGVECTADTCDAAQGCQFAPQDEACDDGVACTTDTCDAALGCQFTPDDAACDDGIACTVDSCDAALGCVFTPDDAACDDGVECTVDACDAALGCVITPDDGACEDGISCTAGACDAALGCQFTPDDALCDDGIACTAGACDAALDCQYTPDDALCDDGISCTTGACDLAEGCQYTPDDGLCDDGVACTIDTCDAAIGCLSTPSDALCDDGIGCTVDACDADTGCSNTPDDSLCDDGDPCTLDLCDAALGCLYQPIDSPECAVQLEGNQFCAASGSAGTTVTCLLRLSRFNQATPPAAGLSFGITFDPAVVAPQRFLADVCVGPGGGPPCEAVEVPPGDLATGHSLLPAPSSLGDWSGSGDVFVLHFGEPTLAITEAYQQGGAPIGETVFAKLEVLLLEDVEIAEPSHLEYEGILGTTGGVFPLVGAVDQGIMVMSVAQCAEFPGICDDGDPCTTDTCDAASGACLNTPIDCDDGDVCNGEETCNPAIGCVPGTPLDCDDGFACSVASCDPALGCVYETDDSQCDDGVACTDDVCVPGEGCVSTANDTNCDDGVSCTVDTCDAALGCSNVASDALCDDGFPCTTESCDPVLDCQYETDDSQCPSDDGNPCTIGACVVGAGCANVAVLDDECLPEGALCALSGAAGETVVCPIRVARAAIGTPAVSALQFGVVYDPASLTATGAQDEVCMGAGGGPPCALMPVPPATLFPSDHSAVPAPADLGDWMGAGSWFLFNLDDPGATLSDAYLTTGGTFVGDTLMFELLFQLEADVEPDAPVLVEATNITGGTAAVTPLVGTVQAGVMVLAVADCGALGDACNDGDPCTLDTCDLATGACSYTPVECSDGDACNGLETCLPLIGCQPGLPPVCNDGALCTTDSCDPATGCVYEPNDAICDDGVACTLDTCVPFEGCVFTPQDLECNDGVACTEDVCDPVIGCTNAPSDALCDDGAECSTGTCDAALGCQFAFDDSECEDDGNPCTAAECVLGVGCTSTPLDTPECLEPGALCAVSGGAGETVLCPLRLARATAASPTPAALQLTLSWDAALAGTTGFQATVCPMGPGSCMEVDTPPATNATGHSVYLGPSDPSAWMGSGTAFYLNTSEPELALSGAYVAGGGVIGEAEIGALRLVLTGDVDPSEPLYVYADAIQGSTGGVHPMPGEVVAGTMVVELADCTAWPSACDDGDACTTDVCDAATGACSNLPVDCGDGDACNGEETCLTWLGCVLGPPPICDDGQPCTLDACDAALGCVYTPVDAECDDGVACTTDTCEAFTGCAHMPVDAECDDGVACTADQCDAAIGCVNAPMDAECDDGLACTTGACDPQDGCLYTEDDAACDDGDPCTLDSCQAGLGCVYVAAPSPACVPDGALCAISGLAGDIVVCPLRLARATQGTLAATSLDIDLALEGAGASLLTIRDQMCMGETCIDIDVPPGTLHPTGHSVTTNPETPAGWTTGGTLIVYHLADPTLAITDAYRAAGAIQGEAAFAELVFQLDQDVSGQTPILLVPTRMEGATELVTLLTGQAWQGTILMATTGCNADPSVCDDGDACTTDSCNNATGQCEYVAAVLCDDGDACNGLETCDPADGSCLPGVPLDCDDGIACTEDLCDPTAGCMNAPDDDACPMIPQECTTPVCYPPAGGCINPANIEGDCLPDGAVCAVFGPAGQSARCRLSLARETEAQPAAVALQFSLSYDATAMSFGGAIDEVCMGPVCMDVPVPPDALSATGHSLALAPADPAAWAGLGSLFFFHLSDGSAALTHAYWQGGAVMGEAKLVDALFTMMGSVSPFAPRYVYAADILGTADAVQSLWGTVIDGTITTAP